MKTYWKQICVVVCGVFLLACIPQLYVVFKIYQVRRADPARILTDCRKMIAERSTFRNDRDRWELLPGEDTVVLLPPIPENVPQEIRQLHPRYIEIRKDNVLINFTIPFARAGILGFQSGAQQYGTYQFIDGLWFWNGDRGSSSQK